MKKFIILIIIILIVIGGAFFVKNKWLSKNEISEDNTNIQENPVEGQNSQVIDNSMGINVPMSSETSKETNLNVEETSTETKNNETQEYNQNTDEKNKTERSNNNSSIKTQLSPSGFMGSSLLRVIIYSNGDVFVLKYDGEGYEDSNIVQKELIATNAESIYTNGTGEDFESIVVKGNSNMEIKINNYSWIEFKK